MLPGAFLHENAVAQRVQHLRAGRGQGDAELPDLQFFRNADNHPCNFPPMDQCSLATSSNTIHVWSSVTLQCLLMTFVSSSARAFLTSGGLGNIEMRTNGIRDSFISPHPGLRRPSPYRKGIFS